MQREWDILVEEDKNISVFLEYMKHRNPESLGVAKKALRNIKSYSSTRKDGKGFKIRIKCKNEEKIFNYSFPMIYGVFMERVTRDLDLGMGRVGYLENTGGFLLNYISQRGYDSIGFTINEEEWEKSIFANFPVYRREYLKRELPHIVDGFKETNDLDIFIWIVHKLEMEKPIVEKLFDKKIGRVAILSPIGVDIRISDFKESVQVDDIIGLNGEEYRYILLSRGEYKEKRGTYFPFGIQVLDTNSAIFKVEMEKCRDNNGFMYTEKGHYFVETLRQFEKNEQLDYQNSYLKEYYQGFQPQNRRDNYLWEEGVECFPMDHGWLYDPWRKPANPPLRKRRFETRKGGNHNIGPNTLEFGQAEFKRLVGSYQALKRFGYNPDFFVDGYITGYLLVRKDDYRFVASEGQHRIAALAALGYDSFDCRFDLKPWTSEAVFYNQALKWPQVKAGIFSPKVAKMCFEHFFRSDNNSRLIKHLKKGDASEI